jgi:hypothetical protein
LLALGGLTLSFRLLQGRHVQRLCGLTFNLDAPIAPSGQEAPFSGLALFIFGEPSGMVCDIAFGEIWKTLLQAREEHWRSLHLEHASDPQKHLMIMVVPTTTDASSAFYLCFKSFQRCFQLA